MKSNKIRIHILMGLIFITNKMTEKFGNLMPNENEVITFNNDNEDHSPVIHKTTRSVFLARNYLIFNVIIQCIIFGLALFFVLAETWYSLKVKACYKF